MFEDLNENVVFMFENLVFTEKLFGKKLDSIHKLDPDYTSIKNLISLAISLCLKPTNDSTCYEKRLTKLRIFSYLLKSFFAFRTAVPSIKLNQYLLIDLMIDTQFEDFYEVSFCLIFVLSFCMKSLNLN